MAADQSARESSTQSTAPRDDGFAAIVLEGEPGIGKTALWRAGVDVARAAGMTVLTAQPTAIESRVPYSALGDIVREVPESFLSVLTEPLADSLRSASLSRLGSRFRMRASSVAVWRTCWTPSPATHASSWLSTTSSGLTSRHVRRLPMLSVASDRRARECSSLVVRRLEQPPKSRMRFQALSSTSYDAWPTQPVGSPRNQSSGHGASLGRTGARPDRTRFSWKPVLRARDGAWN